jgi:hypothetical protein
MIRISRSNISCICQHGWNSCIRRHALGFPLRQRWTIWLPACCNCALLLIPLAYVNRTILVSVPPATEQHCLYFLFVFFQNNLFSYRYCRIYGPLQKAKQWYMDWWHAWNSYNWIIKRKRLTTSLYPLRFKI